MFLPPGTAMGKRIAAGTPEARNAWFGARLLESLLFEVRSHDPLLLRLAVMFLLAAAFLSAWIPARRAMRVDPMIALRYE
jgi:ABC-type lipoprotein release transport system permease subunit